MLGTRDYVNSTLIKMKPRRHRLLTRPPPMAQQHIPPYSSPSPMWLIVVSSAVVTRHHGQPQPSSSSSASSITPSIVVRSSSSFPHFPLRSPSPLPSPSSSYLHRILFDCCVLSVVVVVHCHVVYLLLLKILASAGATLLSPRHRLPTLSALALSSI
jgi:hypothetical protein